jgi:hypothetical protein
MRMKLNDVPKIAERSVTICGKPLGGLLHTCAFVDSRDEQYEILAPFLFEGLACNDCLLTVTSPQNQASNVERLREAGIDVDKLVSNAQLLAPTFENSYLQDGCFSAKRMLAMLESLAEGTRTAGFAALRGFGEMDWALSGLPGTEQLMEYEAGVNYLAAKFNDPLVCIYDVNKFSGQVLMDVLCTHPKVILSGQIHENPYYVPPDKFMASLAARNKIREQARHAADSIRLDAAFGIRKSRILAKP